jgi:hypothetical protein
MRSLQSKNASSFVDQPIPWLLDGDRQLGGLAFSDVILAATGKHVFSFDLKSAVDQRVIKQVGGVLDEAMKWMNAPESATHNVVRINELSSHIEDLLRELINGPRGLRCDFPRMAEGHFQHSGYPDLRIVDGASQRVFVSIPNFMRPAAARVVFARSIRA